MRKKQLPAPVLSLLAVSALLIFSLTSLRGAPAPNYVSGTANECSPRQGLPNFFAKLQQGEPVTIAYLGGSITDQEGWRVLSRQWFAEQYPSATITGINAGVGGTGSMLGVFRLEHDALLHKPDLLFVEFSVNDANASPSQITKSMEGIVRQTWATLPSCDICFVYTVTANDTPHLQAGEIKRSTSIQEKVAEHYGIPSIHMGLEVSRLEKEGKLSMKEEKGTPDQVAGDQLNASSTPLTNPDGIIPFSKDGVHPYLDTGHKLYLQAIARSIPALKVHGQPGNHISPPPMDSGNWEQAHMYAIEPWMVSGPFHLMDNSEDLVKRLASNVPGLWKAESGASLSFQFKGSKLLIYDILGPGCGMVEINIDGSVTKKQRMDGFSKYDRLSMLAIADDLDPMQIHTLTITVLNDSFDKRNVLLAKNREDYDQHPEKYIPNNWYPGAILLVGEIIQSGTLSSN